MNYLATIIFGVDYLHVIKKIMMELEVPVTLSSTSHFRYHHCICPNGGAVSLGYGILHNWEDHKFTNISTLPLWSIVYHCLWIYDNQTEMIKIYSKTIPKQSF